MKYQPTSLNLYAHRALYSPGSTSLTPSPYPITRLPIQFSVQSMYHSRKIKQRVEEIRNDRDLRNSSFNFVQAKNRIKEAERKQWNFSVKSWQKPAYPCTKFKHVHTQGIEKVPELTIQRQPIRCKTECKKTRPQIDYSSFIKVTKKRINNENNMSPVSRSLVLNSVNPEQERGYHLFTEPVPEMSVSKIGLKNGRKLNRAKKEENRKIRQQSRNMSKRSCRSEDKIKGWQVNNPQKQSQDPVNLYTK